MEEIVGKLVLGSDFPDTLEQRAAWVEEIQILRSALGPHSGAVYFEYSIPRMGERIDVLLIIGPVIFVLEFKTGAQDFSAYAVDQVTDYALDLKNFHETSHDRVIAPILIATGAKAVTPVIAMTPQNDKLLTPIRTNAELLGQIIKDVLSFAEGEPIDWRTWRTGRYSPTPTIMEAALALYRSHSVAEISRSDAGAINLRETSDAVSGIIQRSKSQGHKSICFVTGVPGAGKTLVGLNIATKYIDTADAHHSIFLSGNGPLVRILQEALARDMVATFTRFIRFFSISVSLHTHTYLSIWAMDTTGLAFSLSLTIDAPTGPGISLRSERGVKWSGNSSGRRRSRRR